MSKCSETNKKTCLGKKQIHTVGVLRPQPFYLRNSHRYSLRDNEQA